MVFDAIERFWISLGVNFMQENDINNTADSTVTRSLKHMETGFTSI